MKIISTTLFLSLMIVFSAFSQDQKLKGPEYKNRKPWKTPIPETKVVAKDGQSKKGSGVKLLLPMERREGNLVVVNTTTKEKPKGPEYKNRKNWKMTEAVDEDLIAKD